LHLKIPSGQKRLTKSSQRDPHPDRRIPNKAGHELSFGCKPTKPHVAADSQPCSTVVNLRPYQLYWMLNTFITSSPRWLMTLTAILPDDGLGNGREMVLLKLAQVASSISAFRDVLRAL